MTAHATLGASAAYRWWACPGSPRMIAQAPPAPPSRFALEGTAAHAVLAWCFTEGGHEPEEAIGRPIKTFVTDVFELVAMSAVGILEVDEEMAEGVAVHRTAVLRALTVDALLQMEAKVDLTALSPPAPMFGTADTILFHRDSGILRVYDFKYGRGVAVEAKGNPQLRYYALGAWLQATKRGQAVTSVESVIIQPRAPHPLGPVRSETLDPMELYDWHTELMDAARATQAPDAPLVAGDHCRFCPAAGMCPALRDQALATAQTDFSALPAVTVPEPSALSPSDLCRILDGADLLEQWIDSVRSYARGALERGEALPGWKLAEKVGHRKWRDEAKAEVALLTEFRLTSQEGDLLYNEPDFKSPAQMEKLLTKAQRDSAAFKALWHKPVTGTTMVRQSSPRPAVESSAQRDFTEIAEEIDLLG